MLTWSQCISEVEKYISFSDFSPQDKGLLLCSAVISIIISLAFWALNFRQVASYHNAKEDTFVYVYKNKFWKKYAKRPVLGGDEISVSQSEFKKMLSDLTQRTLP